MSRFRKIDTRIWNDAKFISLTDDAKLMFLFLLTHPHMTMLGAMRASIAGLSEEIGWTLQRFSKGFAELFKMGLVNHDKTGLLISLPNYLKYNPIENPNQYKGAISCFDLLPECEGKNLIIQSLSVYAEKFGKPLPKPLPKGLGKQGEGEGEGEGPKPPEKKFKRPSLEDVSAYCVDRENCVDSESFLDHYDAKGWMIGKNPMKDWKAAVRTWEKSSKPVNKKREYNPARDGYC